MLNFVYFFALHDPAKLGKSFDRDKILLEVLDQGYWEENHVQLQKLEIFKEGIPDLNQTVWSKISWKGLINVLNNLMPVSHIASI